MTLFHSFDSLTDDKGNSLSGYQVIVRGPGNGPIQPIYADANMTPIYSVSGIVNTALTDSAGNWSFFVLSGTYDLEFRDPNGTYLRTVSSATLFTGQTGAQGIPGPADNTYTSYAALIASDRTALVASLSHDTDVPPHPDAQYYSDGTSPWSIQTGAGVAFKAASANAMTRDIQSKAQELWRSPEDFKAAGVSDAAAIQAAHDAIVATGKSGVLRLTNGATYSLNTGITLNTAFVTLEGDVVLDCSGMTSGAAITVVCTERAGVFNGSDGLKSAFRGNVVLKGPGMASNVVGLDLNSPTAYTAAQMKVEGTAIGLFGYGVRFSNRGYNSVFVKCDITQCGVCIDWPAGGLDNNERNTFLGCNLSNSGTAVRNYTSGSKIDLISCSLDYNAIDYDVQYGRVESVSCHHESIRWSDRPIRCDGDGAVILITGGTMVNQNATWTASHIVDTGTNGVVKLRDVFANNMLLTPMPGRSRTWATGGGRFELTGMESFNFGIFPLRLNESTTCLSDPGFEAPALGQDLIWRTADGPAITTRYGVQGADNLSLSRVTSGQDSGSGCLAAYKNSGANTNAAFNLICLPVRGGDKVLAGFRVRGDPNRSGGKAQMISVSGAWAKLDGMDANHVPVTANIVAIGVASVTPTTDAYQSVEQLFSMSSITAPVWATHFVMSINLFAVDMATILFDNLWADRC